MEFLFFWVVFSVLLGWWASSRGRIWADYFLLSLLLSPLVAMIVLLVKPDLAKEARRLAEKRSDDARRDQERREEHERQIESIRVLANAGPTAGVSVADELTKLAKLLDDGRLTNEEFAAQKAALLAGGRSS